VVIDDLDIVSIPIPPNKTNAPLIIDSNAVLSLSISAQRLQAIARGGGHIT
jgi:hypothetical protein